MMEGHKLLKNIYVLNIYTQELVAIVAKTFALNDKCLDGVEDNADVAFSKVLSQEKIKTKKFASDSKYKIIRKEIFEDGNLKKPLNGSINATKLDSAFLLSLMLNTDFLDISHEDGTCALYHGRKYCCGRCNHKMQGKCTGCQKSKSECDDLSKICCNNCKKCISCINVNFDAFCKAAMKGKASHNAYQDCSICVVKRILTEVLHFRNLFHLTADKANDFINGSCPLEKFPNIKTAEELLLHMKIMCSTMFSLVKNSCFKEQVENEEIEKVQKTIECIFVNDSVVDQILANDFLKAVEERFAISDEQYQMIKQNYYEIEMRMCELEKENLERKKEIRNITQTMETFQSQKKRDLADSSPSSSLFSFTEFSTFGVVHCYSSIIESNLFRGFIKRQSQIRKRCNAQI